MPNINATKHFHTKIFFFFLFGKILHAMTQLSTMVLENKVHLFSNSYTKNYLFSNKDKHLFVNFILSPKLSFNPFKSYENSRSLKKKTTLKK